jgi:hypothetical protein
MSHSLTPAQAEAYLHLLPLNSSVAEVFLNGDTDWFAVRLSPQLMHWNFRVLYLSIRLDAQRCMSVEFSLWNR